MIAFRGMFTWTGAMRPTGSFKHERGKWTTGVNHNTIKLPRSGTTVGT